MQLYYFPVSTYSQKVQIALYEKGVDFERKPVNLMDPAARAAYEEIYPIGKIPLLMVAGDHMIPESSIILEYLDTHCSGTRLIPEGVDAARQARFMERMNDLYVNDAVVTLLFAGMKPEADRDAEAIAKARKHLNVSYKHLDQRLQKNTWVLGDDFSIADCALIPALFYAQGVHPFADYPGLVAYWERAKARPSYARVQQEFVPMWEEFARKMA